MQQKWEGLKSRIKRTISRLAKKDGKLDLAQMNLTIFYFRNESWTRFLLCCIRKSTKELREKMILDRGSEQLKDELNFKNVIDRIRLCQFETKHAKDKNLYPYQKFDTQNELEFHAHLSE